MRTFTKLMVVIFFLTGVIPSFKTEDLVVTASKSNDLKYVFLFIGDGMGEAHISGTEMYKAAIKSDMIKPNPLSFTLFDHVGLMSVHNTTSYIPDSASAATAMSCGTKTHRGAIGMYPDLMTPATSIAKLAKQSGMKVGILSSVPLNHATPAAFYANTKSRYDYYEIGRQMSGSEVNFFAGGGLLSPLGNEQEEVPLNELLELNGYQIIKTQQDFELLSTDNQKVYIQAPYLTKRQALQYEIDKRTNKNYLADYVKAGIKTLDNKDGFFMMVESGKIDWASHYNDATTVFNEILAFDKAIVEAVSFAVDHPDETLIIVTADHETGGLSLGHKETGNRINFELLEHQTMSAEMFSDQFTNVLSQYPNLTFEAALNMVTSRFGLVTEQEDSLLNLTEGELGRLEMAFEASKLDDDQVKQYFGGNDPFTVTITQILNEKVGIGWSTYSHTATPVSVYATGVGANEFEGRFDNTELYIKLTNLLQLN